MSDQNISIQDRLVDRCMDQIKHNDMRLIVNSDLIKMLTDRVIELEAKIERLEKPRNAYNCIGCGVENDSVYEVWKKFWNPILKESAKGLNNQIKIELYDYYCQMSAWSRALYELTDGKLSKSTYTASVIISEVTECFEERFREEREEEEMAAREVCDKPEKE